MFWLLIPKHLRPLKIKIVRGSVVIVEGTVKNPPSDAWLKIKPAPAPAPLPRASFLSTLLGSVFLPGLSAPSSPEAMTMPAPAPYKLGPAFQTANS